MPRNTWLLTIVVGVGCTDEGDTHSRDRASAQASVTPETPAPDAIPTPPWAAREDPFAWWDGRPATTRPATEGETSTLLAGLNSAEWRVRSGALSTLSGLRPVTPALWATAVRALDDPEEAVRYTAGHAMARLAPLPADVVAAVSPLLGRADCCGLAGVLDALRRTGEPAVQALDAIRAATSHADGGVRLAAIRASLVLDPDPERCGTTLAACLEDEENLAYLLRMLPVLGPAAAPAVPGLCRALRAAPDGRHAPEIVLLLGAIGPPAAPAIPTILEAFDRRQEGPCLAVEDVVGRIGTAAIPALVAGAHAVQPDGEPRASATVAVDALGRIGGRAIAPLVAWLGEPALFPLAAGALCAAGADAAPALLALLPRVNDPDPEVRRLVARTLAAIGPAAAEAVPPLLEALRPTDDPAEPQDYFREEDGTLCYIVRQPGHDSPRTDGIREARRMAVHALVAIGPEALSGAERLREDPDPVVRAHVGDVLKDLPRLGPAPVPDLVARLEGDDWHVVRCAADHLAIAGPAAAPALPRLVALVHSRDAPDAVIEAAVHAIGCLGGAASGTVPDLTEALAAGRASDAVIEALGRLGPVAVAALPQLLAKVQKTGWDWRGGRLRAAITAIHGECR